MKPRDDIAALRLAAIEVLLHRCCWCAPKEELDEQLMCHRCIRAFDRLAELVGMKSPDSGTVREA